MLRWQDNHLDDPGNLAIFLDLGGNNLHFFQQFLGFAFTGLAKVISPILGQVSPIETAGT